MEWLVTLVVALGVIVLLAPVITLLGTFFVLVPLAHLAPGPATLARARCTCPVSRRLVNIAFLSRPGDEHPSDVASCSVFGKGVVRCKKSCVRDVATRWTPSAMTPRYALVAGGTVLRDVAQPVG